MCFCWVKSPHHFLNHGVIFFPVVQSFNFSAWLVDLTCEVQSFPSFDHTQSNNWLLFLDRSEVKHLIHMMPISYLTSWVGCLWVIFSQFHFMIIGAVQGEADCCSTFVILRSIATRKLFCRKHFLPSWGVAATPVRYCSTISDRLNVSSFVSSSTCGRYNKESDSARSLN